MSNENRMTDFPLTNVPCSTPEVGGGLKTIVLCPDGKIESRRGTFTMDAESAASIVAEFERHRTELVIDFEHQSLGGAYAAPSGRAPAAGWITKVWYEKSKGLLGLVRWNPEAKELIRGGAYQYLSPTLLIDVKSAKPVALDSAAVTNRPAIPGMAKLAASAGAKEQAKMETKNQTEFPELNTLLALCDNFDPHSAGLLKGAADGLRTKLESLEKELVGFRETASKALVKERLAPFVASNQITPAMRPHFEALAAKDWAHCELICKSLPVFAPTALSTPPNRGQVQRMQVVREAAREFRDTPAHQKATSLKAFCDQALREAGQSTLSEAEAKELISA